MLAEGKGGQEVYLEQGLGVLQEPANDGVPRLVQRHGAALQLGDDLQFVTPNASVPELSSVQTSSHHSIDTAVLCSHRQRQGETTQRAVREENTLFFFSRPPMMRSTAFSKSTMVTASLLLRAAKSAASLHTLAMSAPAKPAAMTWATVSCPAPEFYGETKMCFEQQAVVAGSREPHLTLSQNSAHTDKNISRTLRLRRTRREGGHALGVVLDGLVQLDGGQVHLEDLVPPVQVRPVDADLPVEAPRPQQRLRQQRAGVRV